MRLLLEILALYLLYKLVVNFIIPIYKISTKIKKDIKNQQESDIKNNSNNNKKNTSKDEKVGEYIDYEEIK